MTPTKDFDLGLYSFYDKAATRHTTTHTHKGKHAYASLPHRRNI